MPVCSTCRIPLSTSRSGRALRPGYRCRRERAGISGSISAHSSSSISNLDGTSTTSDPRQHRRRIRGHGDITLFSKDLLSVDYADCVPEDPFGRGYALASMWELYAQKHAGVCLVFDRERLVTNLV